MGKKKVGIIGGMGPAATALLFEKIIEYTDASSDREHIHVMIDSRPSIPDRTAAILNGNNTPAKYICESGRKLEEMGAELIAIPCNTSHYFYPYIQNHLGVPVIHMPEETAKECQQLGFSTVGVLATTGTVRAGIYEEALKKTDIQTIYPNKDGQKKLMSIIYDYVKAGKKADSTMFQKYLDIMKEQGAQAFILGCTELPMVFKAEEAESYFINSLDILAKRVVELAGYPLKRE